MKYKHRGYQDEDPAESRREREPERPRRDPDLPGGRLAEPQRAIRQLRCHRCGQSLPLEVDARGDVLPVTRDATCGNCQAAVRACRNCINFDPDAHMECRKPIKVRFKKDAANECELFDPKIVVEMTRDQSRPEGSFSPTAVAGAAPKTRADARKAFDDLFK